MEREGARAAGGVEGCDSQGKLLFKEQRIDIIVDEWVEKARRLNGPPPRKHPIPAAWSSPTW